MFPTVPNDAAPEAPQNAPAERPVNDTPEVAEPVRDSSPARTEGVSEHRDTSGSFTAPRVAPDIPRPVANDKPQDATDDTWSHYVHLADGRILKADLSGLTEAFGVGHRYYENRGEDNESSVPVIGVYSR